MSLASTHRIESQFSRECEASDARECSRFLEYAWCARGQSGFYCRRRKYACDLLMGRRTSSRSSLEVGVTATGCQSTGLNFSVVSSVKSPPAAGHDSNISFEETITMLRTIG